MICFIVRSLRFLPLAFFAGVHGFAIFAPYVALVLAAGHLIHLRRARAARATALRASALLAGQSLPLAGKPVA